MNLKSQLHNNSPTILAGLGVLGFLGAIVMTAKAAPKAERKLKHLPQNATLKDKVKVVTPVYAPVAGMALISTACIVGSNRIHNYRYGALLALYSIGQQSLERWQDSALEVVGQKKFEKIVERDREPREMPPPSPIMDDERVIFWDNFSGRWFRAPSIESVRKVVNDINEKMFREDWAHVNDFYSGVGLEPMEYGDEWGWDLAYGACEVAFDAFIKEERPVVSVTFRLKPRMWKNVHGKA